MKIEKKLVSLSIIALVLGIIAILPIMLYAPSAAEPQIVLMSTTGDLAAYGSNVTLVVVPSDPTDDNPYLTYTLMSADEFFATYGNNATIPYVPFLIPTSEPGE